ncbi:MAG: LysE family translocator [Desulfobacterales bacterium]|nr:LysE family translocator [Desulfobacterales bacterium]
MIHSLIIGTILGLSAGLAPGPLLALVISETLEHDVRSGIKVALAPVITDLPIIVLTLFILAKLAHFHNVLGIISMAGGCFVLYMGYTGIRTREVALNTGEAPPKSLTRGILVNALNPHPYLFWFSVGGPTMTRAMEQGIFAAAAFVGSFYLLLVGTKIILAMVVGRSKSFLNGRVYLYTMRLLGLILCGLALVLFGEGLQLLAIV